MHSKALSTRWAATEGGEHVQGPEREKRQQAAGTGSLIQRSRAWIAEQPALMAALHELRGDNPLCWCAPDRCDADVLRLANR